MSKSNEVEKEVKPLGIEELEVEDRVRLKELELQTQYELKYLSESFAEFKGYVREKFDSENGKSDLLNKKVNWLMIITTLMLTGADMKALLALAKTVAL